MIIFLRYLPALAVAGAIGLAVWWVVGLVRENAALEIENASLTRSLAALEQQAEQSKLAREVEAARAEAQAKRNAELQATIETIFTGDFTDAVLDPDLAARLNSLRGNPN